MRSSKMVAGGGRAAIFLHLHNGDRKTRPRSWLTSFPAPPSWIQDGGATSNVWRTSELPWNPQKGVVLVKKKSPVDVWSYFFFYFSIEIQKSIWSLASPNHSRNGSGSCPLATTGKSISLHVSTPRSMKRGVDFGKHLLYFFFYFMGVFFILTVLYNSLELLYSTVS